MGNLSVGYPIESNDGIFLSRVIPNKQQWLFGAIASAVLLFAVWANSFPTFLALLIGLLISWKIFSSALGSLLALIGINILISSRPQFLGSSDSGMSPIDILAGFLMVGILVYWVIRIRIFERESLAMTSAQLSLIFFFLWAISVSVINAIVSDNDLLIAIRQLLNLSPLFIIPILYVRIIAENPHHERWIFAAVLVASVIILIENTLQVRHSVVNAVYLYETRRANLDLSINALAIIAAGSYLMSEDRPGRIFTGILFLLLQIAGLAMSLSRTHYVIVPLFTFGIFFFADRQERLRGIRRLIVATSIGLFGIFIIILQSRVLRLLLQHYLLRFTTSSHLGTDLSLMDRFSEWRGEWISIQQTPIIGHGFGSVFRYFDVIHSHHTWIGYSHNSYLYLIFNTGFCGATLFLFCYCWFALKGFALSLNRNLTRQDRVISRIGIGFLIISLVEAYMGPAFNNKAVMIWVGLTWGYFLALDYRLKRLPKPVELAV
jgi:O-antigen ligase